MEYPELLTRAFLWFSRTDGRGDGGGFMDRNKMLQDIEDRQGFWDVIVIGGGATGLGTGVESASRGYKTLLLEQHDFSKGTSSRSTKLVHGGVRYLQQGNISLVLEALYERGLLLHNAPHLVRNQSFIVPNYAWWSGPFYGVGLKVYDLLAGRYGFGPSRILSKNETLEHIPTLETKDLHGGVIYYDGQFDDSRLAINMAQTLADLNGTVINYMKVTGLLKKNKTVNGVTVMDMESGKESEIYAHVVINATGIFADSVLKMDDPAAGNILSLSQGVHIVLDKTFMPGDSAIMVPHTDDGRVLFAVPWHGRVIIGTTDTPVEEPTLEPRALEEEIAFLLTHAARYMTKDPTRRDVLSVFTGIRPLISLSHDKDTAQISRDHQVIVSHSGLVTITGGKWTTYRRMGEDTLDQAALVAGLDERKSRTKTMRLHGWLKTIDPDDPFSIYGSDSVYIGKLIKKDPALGEKLHRDLPYVRAEVIWGVRNEMALSVEDVLARRTRALLLNARASIEVAPEVARIMADELHRDRNWQQDQVSAYIQLAAEYLPAET